jgi:hypothetical protein
MDKNVVQICLKYYNLLAIVNTTYYNYITIKSLVYQENIVFVLNTKLL